jgi:hypothetical protein
VHSRKVAAELAPHVRGWKWLEFEAGECLAADPLINDVRDRDQFARVVKDNQCRRAHTGLARRQNNDGLPIESLDVLWMVTWDARHVVLADEVYRVVDASLRELERWTVRVKSMARRDRLQNFSCPGCEVG